MKSLLSKAALLLLALSLSTGLNAQKGPKWLGKAVFYQIYPSSYQDSDGNGIGDLPGIQSRLDYIKSLGVNAIWLNPIFESGWFDGGYDVIDFYKVDPRFGTNTDFVNLLKEAHKRGIKVCLDLVAGHSSDKCEWFRQSAQGDVNERYADYYIWTNTISEKEMMEIAKRNASVNPLASTKGHFVESSSPRAKYYEKNFYTCQPALNYGYAHPDPSHPWEQSVDAPGPQAVRRELRNIMAFWFDKGVDGFRVDMASSLVKNDTDKTETMKLWDEMKTWINSKYPECALISEWSHPSQAIPAGFNIDFLIHFGVRAYPYLFFDGDGRWGKDHKVENAYFEKAGLGAIDQFLKAYVPEYEATKDKGYITMPTANHDFQRLCAGKRDTPDQLKVAMTFFLTMPGVPFIYYGDEIGMKFQVGLPDKEGSRDRAGSRTPMQWTRDSCAGFSTCKPSDLYLPVDTEGGKVCVDAEANDSSSLLNYVRGLVKLRLGSDALGNDGGWEMVSPADQPYPMVYRRFAPSGESYIIALNPSDKAVKYSLPTAKSYAPVYSTGSNSVRVSGSSSTLKLSSVSAIVLKVQ